jgi:hypothetical protein
MEETEKHSEGTLKLEGITKEVLVEDITGQQET